MNFTGNWIYVVLEEIERRGSLKTMVCESNQKHKTPTSTTHISVICFHKGYPHTQEMA